LLAISKYNLANICWGGRKWHFPTDLAHRPYNSVHRH